MKPKRKPKPLTAFEKKQLGAALVLIKRNNLHLARRVLAMKDRVQLVHDLQVYIRAHSQYADNET